MSIYLDHAATTSLLPAVREAMIDALDVAANPASVHRAGQAARSIVEDARERIANAVGAEPIEVIFTGSGTEANNLAIKGGYWARQRDVERRLVFASAIEHHAVLDPVVWLAETQGAQAGWLPVDRTGMVEKDLVAELIAERANEISLISLMWANNEVGTVQRVAEIAEVAREHDVKMHTDAVQALGSVEVDFAGSGVDALSLTSHKIGGPLGIGALIAKRSFAMTPLLHGGGQERQVRSGTVATPLIVGFAKAVELAVEQREGYARRVAALRADLVAGVRAAVPDAVLNEAETRLPGIANFSFPGCVGDDLLLLLDAQAVTVSTGSACSAGVSEASHVLVAMGRDEQTARSCLRFSLGRSTTADDVDRAVAALAAAVSQAQGATR